MRLLSFPTVTAASITTAITPQDYAGNPNGNVTPRHVGDHARNTATNRVYVASTTANNTWVPIGP